MSTLHVDTLDCPACGASFAVQIAESLNVQRAAIARRWALEGSINQGKCPDCGWQTRLDARLLYVDLERGLWVFKFRVEERDRLPECEEIAEQVFADTMGEGKAPAFIVDLGRSLRPQVCFAYEELFEAAWCAELELEKDVVEVLKHQLFIQEPSLLATGTAWLRLVPPPDEDKVAFAVYRDREAFGANGAVDAGDSELPNMVFVERAAYDELLAQRGSLLEQYPDLFRRPYRSLERYRALTTIMRADEAQAEADAESAPDAAPEGASEKRDTP